MFPLFSRILKLSGRYKSRIPVSYTHLDVYKRQVGYGAESGRQGTAAA